MEVDRQCCLVGALFLIVELSMLPSRQRSDGWFTSALAIVVIALIGAKRRESTKIV
jgi:hypothetical protein